MVLVLMLSSLLPFGGPDGTTREKYLYARISLDMCISWEVRNIQGLGILSPYFYEHLTLKNTPDLDVLRRNFCARSRISYMDLNQSEAPNYLPVRQISRDNTTPCSSQGAHKVSVLVH